MTASFSRIYRKYVILTWTIACNSSSFIYRYDFNEIIVKYEFSQYIELYDVTLTSHYVMVTNKLYLDDRNNEYIVLCKFGSHTISGCRVIGLGRPSPPSPGPGKQKNPGLNRVKITPYQPACDLLARVLVKSNGNPP